MKLKEVMDALNDVLADGVPAYDYRKFSDTMLGSLGLTSHDIDVPIANYLAGMMVMLQAIERSGIPDDLDEYYTGEILSIL